MTKTVHLQTQARYTGEMRNELLEKVSAGTLAAAPDDRKHLVNTQQQYLALGVISRVCCAIHLDNLDLISFLGAMSFLPHQLDKVNRNSLDQPVCL